MTDLYHPDAAYIRWRTGRNGLATFDLYSRAAPFLGSYWPVGGRLVAVGRRSGTEAWPWVGSGGMCRTLADGSLGSVAGL